MERSCPVTAFVVAFNEEKQIAECLASVAFCEEVIVIDSFSTDSTVQIAERMGARVIQRKWSGYIDQKAFGLTQASHEWVLNLDADERVSPELQESIKQVVSNPEPQVVGYYMNRLVYHLGRWWSRGGYYPEYRLRFFRRERVSWGGKEPHEKVIPHGDTKRIAGDLYHYTYQNLSQQLRKMESFSTIAAEEDFRAGKRSNLGKIVFKPLFRGFKFYLLKKGYREGIAGVIVGVVEGYYAFMKYAKVWELQFKESGRGQTRPAHPARSVEKREKVNEQAAG